ncbi:MAG: hypothetical protein ACHQ4H_14790 [Ktedonobacterales bacterium]
MRQWKDKSRTGQTPAVGRGGSGAGHGAGSSGNRRRGGSGSDWRTNSGDAWNDEADYDDPPISRTGRRRRPAQDYEEVDLERALVPSPEGGMMPMGSQAGMLAVPGIPQTDEEERALGIRRPVYIPAAGKRKRKLGTWRVVSGVLSVMLVCVGLCGLGSVLGKNQLASLTQGLVGTHITPVTFSTANVPVTPVATAGVQGKYFSNVVTAEGADVNGIPINQRSTFSIPATVNVVFALQGLPKGKHTVSVQWFLQGVYLPVNQPQNTSKQVSTDGGVIEHVIFSLNYPAAGLGMARLLLDAPSNDTSNNVADPYLGAMIYFALREAPSATPATGTPAKGTPTKGTPTGTSTPTQTPKPKAIAGGLPFADVGKSPAS